MVYPHEEKDEEDRGLTAGQSSLFSSPSPVPSPSTPDRTPEAGQDVQSPWDGAVPPQPTPPGGEPPVQPQRYDGGGDGAMGRVCAALELLSKKLDSVVTTLDRLANGIAGERQVLMQVARSLPDADGILRTVKALYLLETGQELDDVLLAHGKKPLSVQTVHEHVGTPFDGDNGETPAGHPDVPATSDPNAPSCPKCGSPMKLRQGKRGEFWGCTMYPKCRGTRQPGDVPSKTGAVSQGHATITTEVVGADGKSRTADGDDIVTF